MADLHARLARLAAAQAGRGQCPGQPSPEWITGRLMAEAQNYGPHGSHASRVRALELLGKSLGMFTDVVQHEGGGAGGELVIRQVRVETREQIEALEEMRQELERLRQGQGGAGGSPSE